MNVSVAGKAPSQRRMNNIFKLHCIQMAHYIRMALHLRDYINSACLRLKLPIHPKAKDHYWYALGVKSSTQQPHYKCIFSFPSEYL